MAVVTDKVTRSFPDVWYLNEPLKQNEDKARSIWCQGGRCAFRSHDTQRSGVWSMPSHHTSPSSVSPTLVKMELAAAVVRALGLVALDVPGATPKNPYCYIGGG